MTHLGKMISFYANLSIISDALTLVLLPITGILILILLAVVFFKVNVLLFKTFVVNVPTLILPPAPEEYILPFIIASFIKTANCVSWSV